MAGKKLLYARFASAGGIYEYILASNSSDHMQIPSPIVEYYSKDKALNQVGCHICVWDSNSANNGFNRQIFLSECMQNNGYGHRSQLLPSIYAKNVPLYLNGVPNYNGVDMPYVMWVDGSYTTVLHYFTPDGTDLGYLWRLVYNDRAPYFIAGQLYEDGTFTGDYGYVRPHEIISGIFSQWNYHWAVTGHAENAPFINQAIIDHLTEYLPHEPEGELTENGNGDFDDTSDPIDFPDLPSISVLDTGMTQIYEMTSSQLHDLSQFLWSGAFDLDTFKKMFNDPMEAIMNLCIAPLDLTDGAITSRIRIGNITSSVQGQRIFSPYKIIDCGSININEYWANFGDYSPYTKISIFLPYVGVQQMSIDDIMNGTIELKAYCDVLTGSVQYVLKSHQGNRRGHGHNSVLYTWGGNCQYQIPLNASNMSSVVSSIISTTGTIAGAIGSAVATGGMTAPIAIGSVGAVMSNVTSAKTHTQRGGGLGGAVGLFGVQKPYLILERPEQITPENYDATIGSPLEKTDYLSNYAGFVKIKGVNLTIDGATENELNEIETLLKGGVLI